MSNKKEQPVYLSRMISKSEFARMVKRSPAAIDGRIKRGLLDTVKYRGNEAIYLPEDYYNNVDNNN